MRSLASLSFGEGMRERSLNFYFFPFPFFEIIPGQES
jgi:hypothetical protein